MWFSLPGLPGVRINEHKDDFMHDLWRGLADSELGPFVVGASALNEGSQTLDCVIGVEGGLQLI